MDSTTLELVYNDIIGKDDSDIRHVDAIWGSSIIYANDWSQGEST
jgi:hypothetical protein